MGDEGGERSMSKCKGKIAHLAFFACAIQCSTKDNLCVEMGGEMDSKPGGWKFWKDEESYTA